MRAFLRAGVFVVGVLAGGPAVGGVFAGVLAGGPAVGLAGGPAVGGGLAGVLGGTLDAIFPAGLEARQVERERQEPLLPELGIVEVDAELRARFGLFPEVAGFRFARLFVRDDGVTVLELEFSRDGRIERERRPLGPADLETLRAELEILVAEAAPPRPVDTQEGRGGLVLSQTLLGLGYYGWAVPVALDVESARVGVATYLLIAGASFYLPYQLTRHRPVTEPHRDLAFFGSTRGIGAGALLGAIVSGRDTESPGRARLAGGVVGGLAGGAFGYATAERLRPDPGTAALWAAMGDIGFAAGALAAVVAGPYAQETVEEREGDFISIYERTRNPSLGHAMTLAGGAGGMAVGGWMGARQPVTEGNAMAIRSAAVLGAQVGLTAARAATREGRPLAGAVLAGGLGGVALGTRYVRDRRFTEGEGFLIAAGHLAGGASALGLTYLALEDFDDNELVYFITGTLGSIAGAALVAGALDPGSAPPTFPREDPEAGPEAASEAAPALRSPRPLGDEPTFRPQPTLQTRPTLQIHPAGVLSALMGRVTPNPSTDPGPDRSVPPAIPTILTVRF